MVARSDAAGADAIQATMEGVFKFVGIEPFEIVDPTPKNTREYTPMDAGTRARCALQ